MPTQRSLRQTRVGRQKQREGEKEREEEEEGNRGEGVGLYHGAKYAFATAYLMLFACFNYNCCVPLPRLMPHASASSCCTQFLSAPPSIYLFLCVCILFCALLRAILICIFIPWPAERAAQHIFRLYAYYYARDRRTERNGRQKERERETDNRQIRCVGGEREGSLKRAALS